MKTKALILAALAALLIPSFAQAKPENGEGKGKQGKHVEKMRERMKTIDADGDKVITRDEATAANAEKLLERFDDIDADGDGSITRDEMKAHRKTKGEKKGKGSRQDPQT